jgi:hypothetical protein
VGGWVHNNALVIDLVTPFAEEESALTVAKSWGEIAIGKMDSNGSYINELEVV